MVLEVARQERYSRLKLLLRTFFGWFYIVLPHGFVFFFLSLFAWFLRLVSWWLLFVKGSYPQALFDFQIKVRYYQLRLFISLMNLRDEYPSFSLNKQNNFLRFEVEYPPKLSRTHLLCEFFLGWLYVLLPHGLFLWFRQLWGSFLLFLSWWIVLFTGKYPEPIFHFQVGTLRWSTRVWLYKANLTQHYPPFTGK
ncbi:MAG: DUF4389 domain-containing protein [Leptospiraceae bacterium]|nr:DUF4389 domain-containing protein [Leptospiraceae bacterium]MDW8307036.1 DUF4389 domain-containing protein [Leptospiraceae bacterium]